MLVLLLAEARVVGSVDAGGQGVGAELLQAMNTARDVATEFWPQECRRSPLAWEDVMKAQQDALLQTDAPMKVEVVGFAWMGARGCCERLE